MKLSEYDLSGLWALGHYGMIPEAVWEYTSVCEVSPRKKLWVTPFGRFSYRQVKFFSGYERLDWDGLPVLLALPEKALCDEWYLAGGGMVTGKASGDAVSADRGTQVGFAPRVRNGVRISEVGACAPDFFGVAQGVG